MYGKFSIGEVRLVLLTLDVVCLQPARVVAALKVLLRAVHACEVVAALEQTVNE